MSNLTLIFLDVEIDTCSRKIIVAAFTSSLLYSIIYLCMRGTLEFKQGIRINLSEENALNRLFGREEYRRFVGTVIKSMLWYVGPEL